MNKSLFVFFRLALLAFLCGCGARDMILEKQADDDPDPNNPVVAEGGITEMHIAAKSGLTEKIKILVEKNARVNIRAQKKSPHKGVTPLHMACFNGHFESAEYLISQKAEVSIAMTTGETPLHMAIMGAHHDIVKMLLEKGANKDSQSLFVPTPLTLARDLRKKELSSEKKRDSLLQKYQKIEALLVERGARES